MPHHYPDLSAAHTWHFLGCRGGQLTREFFRPDEDNQAHPERTSWLWVDELIPAGDSVQAAILEGSHSPHEYSGYDLHVRKQPVITKFTDHDHLIIPDLDTETPGDQTLSIIFYTDFIWTRRSERIKDLDTLLNSAEFVDRTMQHHTAVYAFTGILRVMLDSLNRQLLRNERQTYALEDLFLERGRGGRLGFEAGVAEGATSPIDPLADFKDMPDSRKLVELRIHIAWLRKQFDAFDRVVNSLFDPTQGAFHQANGTELVDEVEPYFQHLSDQIKRAMTKVEHLRDIHTSLDQLLVAEQAEQTNRTLLRLSWVSVIFLPAVVIAGIFGMNISLFGDSHKFGLDSEIAFGAIFLAVSIAASFYRYESRRRQR